MPGDTKLEIYLMDHDLGDKRRLAGDVPAGNALRAYCRIDAAPSPATHGIKLVSPTHHAATRAKLFDSSTQALKAYTEKFGISDGYISPAGTQAGYIIKEDGGWTNCRNAANGDTVVTGDANNFIASTNWHNSYGYRICRSFFSIYFPDYASGITQGVLCFDWYDEYNTGNDHDGCCLVSTTWGAGSLALSDFSKVGSTSLGCILYDSSNPRLSLNSAGRAYVESNILGGIVRFAVRENNFDLQNNCPPGDWEACRCYFDKTFDFPLWTEVAPYAPINPCVGKPPFEDTIFNWDRAKYFGTPYAEDFFEVMRSTDSSGVAYTSVAIVEASQFEDTVDTSEERYYKVKAVNDYGESVYSTPVQACAISDPTAIITGFSATQGASPDYITITGTCPIVPFNVICTVEYNLLDSGHVNFDMAWCKLGLQDCGYPFYLVHESLIYATPTGDFISGEDIIGQSSWAGGTILDVSSSVLKVYGSSGQFQVGETLWGCTSDTYATFTGYGDWPTPGDHISYRAQAFYIDASGCWLNGPYANAVGWRSV